MKMTAATALLVSTLSATGALAAQRCDVPMAQWQPREALQAKLEAGGWQIRSIKAEGGCYEAYAIDAKGEKIEAYFDPRTLEQVSGDNEDDEG